MYHIVIHEFTTGLDVEHVDNMYIEHPVVLAITTNVNVRKLI